MANQENFVYTHLSGVSSKAIKTVAYNENTLKMYVKFIQGNEYIYSGVSLREFEAFVSADSVGQYYTYNISGNYTSTKAANVRLRKSEAKKPAKQNVQAPISVNTEAKPSVVNVGAIAVTPRNATYSIAWEQTDGKIGGNPRFTATDEADALRQFNEAFAFAEKAGFTTAAGAKITSITRYFD